MLLNNNLTSTEIQPWFIPIDILQVICTAFAVILALIFLFIIIFEKTCHTIPMLLVANSFLADFVFGCAMLFLAAFSLRNDLMQIQFYDTWCLFQGCMSHMSVAIQNYSYLLQAIYRYISILYPTRLYYQSFRFQMFLICLTWICSIIYSIPLILTNQIQYHVNDQTCQMPLNFSFITIFNVTYAYLLPMTTIILLYWKMVRYVHGMNQRVLPVNTVLRAQRDLKMIRRIVILVIILVALGLPYTIFIFMSFFTAPPKYSFRIAFIFVDGSLASVMIVLFQFTEPLKTSLSKMIRKRPTVIVPTMT
ncbi:unnamed protein product [Adineta steineri]|uniref:G-protein coupled receptors family 1 profile domain-containing protein n=1 Tax=Adineta steineri TaxID=433720 RepID=A0A816DS07_9BILA|nr:unnamed protein product [Adineta steineri]CAF1638339.1 unnamed protein product [Adineta steineri]